LPTSILLTVSIYLHCGLLFYFIALLFLLLLVLVFYICYILIKVEKLKVESLIDRAAVCAVAMASFEVVLVSAFQHVFADAKVVETMGCIPSLSSATIIYCSPHPLAAASNVELL